MRVSFASLAAMVGALIAGAHGYDPTDSIMDGDSAQSGYLPNHNMDPAVVTGGSFGQIWRYKTPTPANGLAEQFYAKPLIYTPSSTGLQVVLVFSEQNKMYVLDAVNGTLYASRDLSLEGEAPFLASDLGSCNDISGTIGITGTPVIDPATDTVYFWAKSYLGAAKGYQNGAYRFHAVDAATLAERPGFPTNLQGAVADNDNTRYFTGGTVLQRASLNMVNGVIFAGFGGHCDQYNFTGWVVGMSTAGSYVTGYVTSGGLGAPPQDGTWNGGGGGSGVWMSGMPLASDNSGRLFFATGNGYKTDVNQQQPASGRLHLDTLSECMVNMAVNKQTGVITQQDYFEPYEYLAMDQGDRDLGSGGVCLPDPGTFSGGGVARLAITCGKNSKCYITNADSLGGYKLGPSSGDLIVQTLSPPSGGSIFGNVGTYPLEGGFLYFTPVGSPTYVYGLGHTQSGLPAFTLAGQTDDSSTGRVGVGPATITTYKGQEGTGILWVVDPDAGLRAYQAVPVNGKMIKIPLPASVAVSKFQRPAFGNGRYYLSTSNGNILAFGSPVALPLTCNSPIDFGSVPIGSSSSMTVTCTANIAITKINGLILGNTLFQATNASLPTGALAAGQTFSFPVVFNLGNYSLSAGSTSAPAVSPGVQSTSISILTTNGATGYATEQPITVTGKSISAKPFVQTSPLEVDFSGIVVGSTAAMTGSDSNFIISNIGQADMTILGYAFTDGAVNPDPGDDPAVYTNVIMVPNEPSILDEDALFTSTNLPPIGSVIPGGNSVTVDVNFNTDDIGDYYTTLKIFTNGGSSYIIFTGAASTSPIAKLEYSTDEGGWIMIPSCQDVSAGCTSVIDFGSSPGLTQQTKQLRFTNNGGSALIITKSKPLEGAELGATNPNTDLSEGLAIIPGGDSFATISFSPGPATINDPPKIFSGVWTLNTNDLTFGVHSIQFTGTVVGEQVGPILPSGNARYKYLGCYLDNLNGVRNEPKVYANQNNDNGLCQQQAVAFGVVFSGTEFMTECWVGSVIPSANLKVPDAQCSYLCPGDSSQTCGGLGGYQSIFYDSTRYFPSNGTIIGASGKGAAMVPTVGRYTYAGCYTDASAARVLTGPGTSSQSGTLESCAAFCNGYSIFGAEYGIECYCGNSLGSASVRKPDTDCSMSCAGNSSEFCGSGSRLSLYTLSGNVSTSAATVSGGSSTPSAVAGPSNLPTVGLYSYVECHTDNTAQRTLTSMTTNGNTMTVETCAAYCAGFLYFGLEYARECYCGNSILSTSTAATDGRCSMACAGNSTELCGGPNGLSLYKLASTLNITLTASASSTLSTTISVTTASSSAATAAYNSLGCYSDNDVTNRALKGGYINSPSMTVESCASYCQAFTYFAIEYSTECYCGNALAPSSGPVTDGRCNMNCGGNVAQVCGGSYGLTLFQFEAANLTTSSTIGATSTTSSISLTSLSSVSTSASSSSTATSAQTTPTLLTCPASDKTIYTTSNNQNFQLECYLDHAGGDMGMVYTDSYALCASACGSTSGCNAFSWVAGGARSPCYLKSSIVPGNANNAVWGGKIVPVPSIATSSSTTVSTLSAASSSTVISTLFTTSSTITSTLSTTSSSTATSTLSTSSSSTTASTLSATSSSTVISSTATPTLSTSSFTIAPTLSTTSSTATSILYTSSSSATSALSTASSSTTASTLSTTSSSIVNSTLSTTSSSTTTSTLSTMSSSTVTSTLSTTSSSIAISTLSTTYSTATSTLSTTSSSIATSTLSTTSSSSTTTSALSLMSSTLSIISSTSSTMSLSTATPSSSVATSTSFTASSSTTSSTSSTTTPSSSVAISTSFTASSSTTSSASSTVTSTTSTTSISSLFTSSSISSTRWLSSSTASSLPTSSTSSSPFSTTTSSSSISTKLLTTSTASTTTSSSSTNTLSGTSSKTLITVTTTSTTSTSRSSQLGTSSITSTPTPNPWAYLGCANDTTSSRALNGATITNATSMTVESCQSFCNSKNYPLAGLEYSSQCYCGSSLAYNSSIGKTGCTMSCAGNSSETCGGSSRLSVYNLTTYVAPILVPNVGNYNLKGCYTDASTNRTLSSYTYTSTTGMTVENCVSTCSTRGFSMAGVEYASECYCGNSLGAAAQAALVADCKAMFCSGNMGKYCGGSNRVLVYSTLG